MSAESAPVTLQPAERLPALDLARGLALLGVGAVNVISFASIWSSVHALDLARHWADVVAEYTVALAFIHRCYPLLGFLFGVGLAWQWQRQPEPRHFGLNVRQAMKLEVTGHGVNVQYWQP